MRAFTTFVVAGLFFCTQSALLAQSKTETSVASETTRQVHRVVDNLVDLLLGAVPGAEKLRQDEPSVVPIAQPGSEPEFDVGDEIQTLVGAALVKETAHVVDRELDLLNETLDGILDPNTEFMDVCDGQPGRYQRPKHQPHTVDHVESSSEWSDWDRFTWRQHGLGIAFGASALFPESVHRYLPATRYNRVEGFVLGVGFPLHWNTGLDRWRPFGQIGYAFALDDWRYELGLETRLGGQRRSSGVRLGGSYYQNTATNDTWKVDGWENNITAFFAEYDFLDYYEITGFNTYLAAQIGSFSEISVAYRSDSYTSLEKNTGWSLFDGPGYRRNPLIDDLDLRSFSARLQTGRVASLYGLPHGWALQGEAEFGDGLGGDVDYQRYLGDARLYISPGHVYGLALRLRGAYATDDAPLQRQFTAGGLGTVRSYVQNGQIGTRLAVANAEFAVDDVDLILSDLQLFAFADMGWTGTAGSAFLDSRGLMSAAGFGVGFDQRRLRFEVAFPTRGEDRGQPWFIFRLNPTF